MRQIGNLNNMVFDGFEIIKQGKTDGRNVLWTCRCRFCGEICDGLRKAYIERPSELGIPAGCKSCRWKRGAAPMIGKKIGTLLCDSVSPESHGNIRVQLDVTCDCGNTFKVFKIDFEKNKCSCPVCSEKGV
jgi:hypothetical protein